MKKVIATVIVIILLAGLVVFAYVRQRQLAADAEGPMRGPTSVPVEVAPVTNSNIVKKIEATGAISARAEVEVYPKQSGEIVELLVDKGDKVKEGQLLAKMDSKLFKIQVRQAQADLKGAEAAYDKDSSLAFISSETSFKQAKGSLDRLKSVLKQSELDLELQKTQADVQIKKADADLRIAEARLDAAVSGARTQEVDQVRVKTENAKINMDRLTSLLKDQMVSQDQVDSAKLQYDIYKAQLSLMEEGARPEDIEVLKAQVETAKASQESAKNDKMLVGIKEANLNAAKAQVESAQAAFEQASMAKDASTWEKDLAQAEASVQRAQASLEMVQQYLDESIIKAPISGTISQRLLDKGDEASPNRPFVTIVDIDVVRVDAKVPVGDVVEIRNGDQAVIKPDAYPGQSFLGKVTNISPVIERTSQTCQIEIEVPNTDGKLKPGMYTRVELATQEHKNVPVIPSDVITKQAGETFVYVVDGDKAAKRNILTGISDGIRTEIISGLTVNDELIVAGQYSLGDGMPITVTGRKALGKPEAEKEAGKQ